MLMLVFLSFLRRALVPRVVDHLSPHPFFSIYIEAIDKPTFKGHSIVTNFRSWFYQRRDKTSVKEYMLSTATHCTLRSCNVKADTLDNSIYGKLLLRESYKRDNLFNRREYARLD